MDEPEFNTFIGEEEEEEKVSFLHPSLLANHKFITYKPKKIKDFVRERVDKFCDRYDYSIWKISEDFYGYPDYINKALKEDNDTQLATYQSIVEGLFEFDLQYSKTIKRRIYNGYKAPNLTRNFLKTFELFCARHLITERAGSSYLLGEFYATKKIKEQTATVLGSTIDRAMLRMYKIDIGLLDQMGDVYEEWVKYGR